MKRSLQRRLSLMLGGAILLAGLVAAAGSFILAYGEAKELQDDILRQTALLATQNTGISARIDARDKNRAEVALGDPESRISVIRLPDDPRPVWLKGDLSSGFHTLEAGDEHLRLFVQRSASGKTTIVAQSTDTRDEISIHSALRTLIPLLMLLPVMVWLIVRIVRSELTPVNDMASHLDAQRADRPLPLSDERVPNEIMPFVHAINHLLKRVSDLMTQQRRFIADAAHELRSPLTALTLQAQNLKHADAMNPLEDRIEALQSGIERARLLTEQLLNLARIQVTPEDNQVVEVSSLARELIADHLPLAETKGIDLGLEDIDALRLRGSPATLSLILKNALDNAIKHTPSGGQVTLKLYRSGAQGMIEIIDTGPGIPVAEHKRVFDPFYRLVDAPGSGSGLGLTIAAEAASNLGGEIHLRTHPDHRGLTFRYQQSLDVYTCNVLPMTEQPSGRVPECVSGPSGLTYPPPKNRRW